jgi:hypothetical protein
MNTPAARRNHFITLGDFWKWCAHRGLTSFADVEAVHLQEYLHLLGLKWKCRYCLFTQKLTTRGETPPTVCENPKCRALNSFEKVIRCGDEALARARAEDQPILLSIGYSSCHWCHVMERESFEDAAVAALMNERFVNIKVDREERPDLDQVYMKAVQAMTGGGGWPMTVFLTPEGVPFYGGTYFPPEPRHGLPSFRQVLQAASDAYRQRGDQVRESGAHLVEALAKVASHPGTDLVGEELLDAAFRALSSQYDATHGGFGRAPKFPQPVTLELLLRHHLRTGTQDALDMAVHTLRRMAAGGLRDHLGGGFHRYSVDARWLVPHFEKMLYDNALLASAYLAAYQVTEDAELREVAEQTLDYLVADMRLAEGGDIDVLARLATPDGGERVPMIRRGNGDGVHLLVGDRFADVGVKLRCFALRLGDHLRAAFAHGGVHVAKCRVLGGVLHLEDVAHVRAALTIEANGADADAVVRAKYFSLRHRAGDDDGSRGLADELSAGELHGELGVGV